MVATSHCATYELENYGAAEFKPPLPPDARVTVDPCRRPGD